LFSNIALPSRQVRARVIITKKWQVNSSKITVGLPIIPTRPYGNNSIYTKLFTFPKGNIFDNKDKKAGDIFSRLFYLYIFLF